MKWQKRRNRAAESADPEFAEALLGNSPERSSLDRKVMRKTQQFCRQVQRALNLALASSDSQMQGCEIFVDEVSPAPDCGHLLAHVGLVDTYRSNLPDGAELWLLLYSGATVARSVPIPNGIETWRVPFRFDRVFWFTSLECQFTEIQKK